MKIENNRFASLVYTLHEGDRDGRVIETVEETAPLGFVFGAGRLLPAFEANLAGLEEGASFEFSLPAVDAYGELREEMVINLPRNIFEDEGVLRSEVCYVGNTVPMMDSQGNRMNGVVVEIGDAFVKMDFNHPLAGTDLHFAGKVVGVREATPEELMGPSAGGCSSCGSKNSGCGGSCG
ncbi:MAG: peptidylprolyl isomerase [Bacteroidales bacterium]|jgi:FKBP-type peptidyl-prolyl cis-trans isomerase SlyD|nr:peptidylprolyl isomerase [Bacteroidales bacterium]MDD3736606.1 peptidylprolyl isomerase [Bacteroidales bacterium]NLD64408.1 peptidylprolyl isomerase [Bacteroidales bacterium]HNT93538.1 peptidylprolyl isomerase [Bacteroidales bacterium]HOO67646.1 peptidylprolyl isomerase [Bacteroidales bacterium]